MLSPPRVKVALVCMLTAAGASVRAQDTTAEARAAFQQGVRQFAERRHAEALESFRRAYRLRPHPSVLVNIANCYVALNQPHQAVQTFERFLGDPTATPTTAQRAEIESALGEARRRIATVNVLAQPVGAEVYLDGDLVGAAPLRRAIQTGPGPHVLEARVAGGGAVQYQARLEPGGALTVTLDVTRRQSYVGSVPPGANEAALSTAAEVAPPPPPPPPPIQAEPPPVVAPPQSVAAVTPTREPPPEEDRGGAPVATVTVRSRGFTAALVAGGAVTAVGLGAGLGFRLYANSLIDEYNSLAAQYRSVGAARGAQSSEAVYLYRQGMSHADAIDQNVTLATVFTVVGALGAAFTVGTVLFWPRTRVPAQLTLHVAPTLDGRGIAVGGTF